MLLSRLILFLKVVSLQSRCAEVLFSYESRTSFFGLAPYLVNTVYSVLLGNPCDSPVKEPFKLEPVKSTPVIS